MYRTRKQEPTNAPRLMRGQSTEELVSNYEAFSAARHIAEFSQICGWLMDELQHRDKAAFDAWNDSSDKSPRKYFIQ